MMHYAFDFPHSYEVQPAEDMAGEVIRIPTLNTRNDGVLLRLTNSANVTYFLMCAFGEGRYSAVLSTPDVDKVCVVSKGAGYIISALAPSDFVKVPLMPIGRVCQGRHNELLAFADNTRLAAFGRNGLAWETADIAFDGIDEIKEEADTFVGRAWAPGQAEAATFVIRAVDGAVLRSARM